MKKKRSKKFNNALTIVLAIGDICTIICFILFYATKFKTTFIQTAMNTMEHQYLARVSTVKRLLIK